MLRCQLLATDLEKSMDPIMVPVLLRVPCVTIFKAQGML